MKKKTIYSILNYNDGHEVALFYGGESSMSSQKLLTVLRGGIKAGEIKDGKKVTDDKYTKYIFEIESYEKELEKKVKETFVIKVRNSEKHLFSQTLLSIDDLCNTSAKIKIINRIRMRAGIVAGLVLFATAGPVVANGLLNCLDRQLQDRQQRYEEYYEQVGINRQYKPTDEDKEKGMELYYKQLEEKAKNGDESAMKEYTQYMIDQWLESQKQEQQSEDNYKSPKS